MVKTIINSNLKIKRGGRDIGWRRIIILILPPDFINKKGL